MILWIAAAGAGLFLAWIISAYNRFVRLKNEAENAWRQIDIQLKRRADLIPNLVSVVKGYMDYERETIEAVVSARALALSAHGLRERAVREDDVSSSLAGLFAVIENYPELKSSEQVLQLQEELTTTENRIAFSRHHYNDIVANYRTAQSSFPDMVVAAVFAFPSFEFFSTDPPGRLLPKASLSRR
ncbi:MAG: LemA family protein [Thermodesulfovibrionales bacterium]